MALFDISANANLSNNDFSTTHKDKGVVLGAGTIAGSRFDSKSLGAAKTVLGGAVVASGTNIGAVNTAAFEAGVFANTNRSGQWVIAGANLGTLAGQTVGVQTTPASNYENRRSPATLQTVEGVRIGTAMRQGHYNHVTGHFDAGFPQVDQSGLFDIHGNASVSGSTQTADQVARDGWTNQGELTYQMGSTLPVTGVYNSKN